MSRVIKFRVWYTDDKEMDVIEDLYFFEENSINTIPEDTDRRGMIIMQYIGLNDGNGREIYEGDIIEIEGATAKVVFWGRPPEFGLDYSHNENAWCEDWNLTDDSSRMEVVGNIYEHPELLEATHDNHAD